MIDYKIIHICSEYATIAHHGQTRKSGDIEYIVHPARVSSLVSASKVATTETICAAWLHDVKEDCSVGQAEPIICNHKSPFYVFENFLLVNNRIEKSVGETILNYVDLLTHNNDEPSKKEKSYQRIKESGLEDVAVIKFCDRIDNLISVSEAFSKNKQKNYIEDTLLMHNYLGRIVRKTDRGIYDLFLKTVEQTKMECKI